MTPTEAFTIVLSVVALIVTIIGFFASLRFYTDGVEMNSLASRTLGKIEEKTAAIQSQVGGMFDRTLNAVLQIGGFQEISREQRVLQYGVEPEIEPVAGTKPEDVSPVSEKSPMDADKAELETLVEKYFLLRQLRLTNVGVNPARFIFNLGAAGEFNLFDGIPGIVFFGFFQQLEGSELVARTRSLLINLELVYTRIRENPEPKVAEEALRLLDQISIELMIGGSINKARLVTRVQEFQPKRRVVDIKATTLEEIHGIVATEYDKMKI